MPETIAKLKEYGEFFIRYNKATTTYLNEDLSRAKIFSMGASDSRRKKCLM